MIKKIQRYQAGCKCPAAGSEEDGVMEMEMAMAKWYTVKHYCSGVLGCTGVLDVLEYTPPYCSVL